MKTGEEIKCWCEVILIHRVSIFIFSLKGGRLCRGKGLKKIQPIINVKNSFI